MFLVVIGRRCRRRRFRWDLPPVTNGQENVACSPRISLIRNSSTIQPVNSPSCGWGLTLYIVYMYQEQCWKCTNIFTYSVFHQQIKVFFGTFFLTQISMKSNLSFRYSSTKIIIALRRNGIIALKHIDLEWKTCFLLGT